MARLQILDHITRTIAAPRPELSPYAPRVEVMKIPVDKIGALIGPGGKNIRRITETYKVEIDVEDDGTVRIYSVRAEGMEAAKREIGMLTAEAEVGKTYQGRVTGIKEFGAFVEILPGLEGLVHVSELANFRVANVEDVCKVGDLMWVKCIHVDENGKIRLSRRAALAERDAAAAGQPPSAQPPPRDQGARPPPPPRPPQSDRPPQQRGGGGGGGGGGRPHHGPPSGGGRHR